MSRANTIRLTQSFVKKVEPDEKRREYWDTDLPGFCLRVEPSGIRTFFVRYRAKGGGRNAPRRFWRIGRYGPVTVDEARKQAKQILGAVANDEDPALAKRTMLDGLKLDSLIDEYEREGIGHLKPLTARYTLARLRNHVSPLLGSMTAADVRPRDIERMLRQIEEGKTSSDIKTGKHGRKIVRGGRGAAGKVARDLSALFSFAVRQELVDANPCLKVRKPAFNQRERFLTPEEIKRLFAALRKVTQDGVNPKAEQIIRLLILTGCRNNEIAGLKWSEVDLERSRLVLAESKPGKSIRPLSAEAKAFISSIEPIEGSEYVFPAERGDGHFTGLKRHWPSILRDAKLEGITPHTLRHTFGSLAASAGEPLSIVGALLGHANPRSTAIYAHLQDSALQDAAGRIGRLIGNGE